MRIARIFLHEPAGFSFDVPTGGLPLAAWTATWRADGFVLGNPEVGPFTMWSNVAMISTYDVPDQGAANAGSGTVVSFPFGSPPPKDSA
jgi:hypothetical protein